MISGCYAESKQSSSVSMLYFFTNRGHYYIVLGRTVFAARCYA